MGMDSFLQWERASRDTIDFKKIYVDMVGGDVLAGLVLSEIVYWYLPTRSGGSKLRVERSGKFWIAVHRYEWWDRTRLSPDQSDRVLKILIDCGLIEKDVFRFGGDPTIHIRLIEERFLELWKCFASNPPENPYLPAPKPEVPISPNGENRSRQTARTISGERREPISPNGENHFAEKGKTLTETTTKTTTETNNLLGAAAPEGSDDPNGIIKNRGAFEALQAFERGKGETDISAFPEDTREIIREFCHLWKIRPPARDNRKGGSFALWINEARELREACGELGLDVLRNAYNRWTNLPLERRFTVGRPGSLVVFTRAEAGRMRQNRPVSPVDQDRFAQEYEYLAQMGGI